eukprot:3137826-Prymnesium_polylepis.1
MLQSCGVATIDLFLVDETYLPLFVLLFRLPFIWLRSSALFLRVPGSTRTVFCFECTPHWMRYIAPTYCLPCPDILPTLPGS